VTHDVAEEAAEPLEPHSKKSATNETRHNKLNLCDFVRPNKQVNQATTPLLNNAPDAKKASSCNDHSREPVLPGLLRDISGH
jgi:hypothetical protein